MNRASAHRERKVQSVAKAVGEIQLGGGKSDVVGGEPQDGLGIQLGAAVHAVLQVHTALGEAGAARALDPEAAVIARGRPGRSRLPGAGEKLPELEGVAGR